MHGAYRQRETVAEMDDSADDWDVSTCAKRHLAVAVDAELRRRHPGHQFALLRSAELRVRWNARPPRITTAIQRP